MKKHPIQPIEKSDSGVVRFKANAIVQYLLDHGGIDLNQLATIDFPQADQEQFAQLIGYSLSGFGELSYVSDETYQAAAYMEGGMDEKDARIVALEDMLGEVRSHLRHAAAAVFSIHPDDLSTKLP